MAHYDLYDYQTYWQGREYENRSEEIALTAFFDQIGIKNLQLLEVGSGFGRLVPFYSHYCSSITLLDPSQKNLTDAKKYLQDIKTPLKFIQGSGDKLPFKDNSFDVAVIVRVMHHLPNPTQNICELSRVLKPGGYLVLEYANKLHIKNIFTSLLYGKLDILSRLHPLERRSRANIKRNTIPFVNHHPKLVESLLFQNHLEIISQRSVSNLRNNLLKKTIQLKTLLTIERELQQSTLLNHLQLSPSVFLLAQKNMSV